MRTKHTGSGCALGKEHEPPCDWRGVDWYALGAANPGETWKRHRWEWRWVLAGAIGAAVFVIATVAGGLLRPPEPTSRILVGRTKDGSTWIAAPRQGLSVDVGTGHRLTLAPSEVVVFGRRATYVCDRANLGTDKEVCRRIGERA